MKIGVVSSYVTFGRAPKSEEKRDMRQALQEGYELLGKKKISMIVPQSSIPVKSGADTGVGTPYGKAGRDFVRNISWWGLNSIQYLPTSRLEKDTFNLNVNGKPNPNPNPYVGSVFSRNELIIDLQELTTDKWGEILDPVIYKGIVDNKLTEETVKIRRSHNPQDEGYDKFDTETLHEDNVICYNYAEPKMDFAMRSAYKKLTDNKDVNLKLKKIYGQFQDFCNKNTYWLEKDSLYYVLDDFYGNVSYENWQGKNAELDRNLFNRKKVGEAEAQKRIDVIKADEKLGKDIEVYKFKQFVLHSQNKDFQKYCEDLGNEMAKSIKAKNKNTLIVKTLDDASSGLGNSQKWGFPDLWIEGWMLGNKSKNVNEFPHGDWKYKIPDFKQLGRLDSLGKLGEFYYHKFSKAFSENRGGIRVDHAQGYINPQVTPEGHSMGDPRSGKLRTTLGNDSIFKDYLVYDESKGIENINDVQLEELGRIFDIILKAAKDNGVLKADIMFEAFDDWSGATGRVLGEKKLGKISVARWNTDHFKTNDWATPGNHDNTNLKEWADKLFESGQRAELEKFVGYLENELRLNRSELDSMLNNSDIEQAKKTFIKYQFVKLFASNAQNIQVFFPDFFGTGEYYQRPNVDDKYNWRIKIHDNYKKEYYEALIKDEGLNLPEIVLLAIEAKIRRGDKTEDGKIFAASEKLLSELKKSARILKEPEKS